MTLRIKELVLACFYKLLNLIDLFLLFDFLADSSGRNDESAK